MDWVDGGWDSLGKKRKVEFAVIATTMILCFFERAQSEIQDEDESEKRKSRKRNKNK